MHLMLLSVSGKADDKKLLNIFGGNNWGSGKVPTVLKFKQDSQYFNFLQFNTKASNVNITD